MARKLINDIDAVLIDAGFTLANYGDGFFYVPEHWTEEQVREVLPGPPFLWNGKVMQSLTRARAISAAVRFAEKYETQ